MSAIPPHATRREPPSDTDFSGPSTLGRLGRYRLLSRLAVGGMAEIFLARVEGIGGFEKAVVVKRLIPQHARDPVLVRMFMDEARLLAKLDHPNITQVHDIGAQDGQYFFAMEYVHGEDLRTLSRAATSVGHKPSDGVIAGIVASAARALHYVHDKRADDGRRLNIVHRDVSPSNILVGYSGVVKLADFGVAKWDEQQTLTTAGTLKGKLAYMSPEQAGGRTLDHRSDIFSLGIVLFELTTGTRLFHGATDMAVLRQLASGVIPLPSRRRPNFPESLQAIVLRALAPDPSHRFGSAQQLADELERFADTTGEPWDTNARAALMHSVFPRKLANWQEAQQEGLTLAEHLARLPAGELTPKVSARALFDDEVTQAESSPPASPPLEVVATTGRWRRRSITAFASIVVAVLIYAGWRSAQAPPPAPPAPKTTAIKVEQAEVQALPLAETPPPLEVEIRNTLESPSARQSKQTKRKRAAKNRTGRTKAIKNTASSPQQDTSKPSDRVRLWDPDSVLLPK